MNTCSLAVRHRFAGWALALLAFTSAVWGQVPPTPVAPAPENRKERVRLDLPPAEPPPIAEPPRSPDAEPWEVELHNARIEAGHTLRDVQRQIGSLRFGYSGPDARRLLIIPDANATDEAVSASRDDLAVMATILSRAVNPDKPRRTDMLLEIDGWRAGAGRELDAILIDGYGAVFLLGVDYPLMELPAPKEKRPEPKASHDNTWEKTRREVLGQPDRDEDELESDENDDGPAGRAFDATRVAELEKRLKEAFRHAGNIRGMKADEWIVVQVSGRATPPGSPSVIKRGSGADRARVFLWDRRGPGGGSSTLTLRARKSAVDDFAANRIQFDEFAREVQVSRRLEKAPLPGK